MESVQIIEQATNRMAVIDLQSKLLQNNIIFITGVFTEESVSTYQAELCYLVSNMTAEESKQTPIKLYINSPGGCAYSCMGLYDVMQSFINQGYVIETVNMGMACSAAGIILLAGTPGHRYATPHSMTMLHQPLTGMDGSITDIEIHLHQAKVLKSQMFNIIAKHAPNCPIETLERDKYMTAEEAIKYNVIDAIKY